MPSKAHLRARKDAKKHAYGSFVTQPVRIGTCTACAPSTDQPRSPQAGSWPASPRQNGGDRPCFPSRQVCLLRVVQRHRVVCEWDEHRGTGQLHNPPKRQVDDNCNGDMSVTTETAEIGYIGIERIDQILFTYLPVSSHQMIHK